MYREHVVGERLIFQSMLRGSEESGEVSADYAFTDTTPFADPRYPVLYFVERKYAGDPTNWWIPNAACAEAMLRSAGFRVVARPEGEVFVCEPAPSVGHAESRAALAALQARRADA